MAFALNTRAPALQGRRQAPCKAARAQPVFRKAVFSSTARRHIGRVAAAEEQETAYQQPEGEQPQVTAADQTDSRQYELEELDAAQEDLLKWMLYLDKEEQQEDLDEMVDYSEFADGEFEEIYEDVEDMYEQANYRFKPGDKIVGTVYEVDEDGAYVEIGAKSAGFVPLSECSLAKLKSPLEVLRPGMKREFVVVEEEDEYGEIILSLAAIEAEVFWTRIRQLQMEDVALNVRVLSCNRGGLTVQYHHVEGFIPMSHFGQSITVENMEEAIGADLLVKLLEVDEERDRLVFSHRRASNDADVQGVNIGDVLVGVVQSVKPYGAFVDIGGTIGLLHISQITNERLTTVDQVLQVGDKLKVMVLSADPDRGRVTLSTKKLEKNAGDMLKDPQLVFENAEAMAAVFRERIKVAEAEGPEYQVTQSMDEVHQNFPQQYNMESLAPADQQQPIAAVDGQQQ